MLVQILTLVIGFLVIIILAELAIKNTLQLAEHYGFSGTFAGLTVLSIGTSIPEIMTHIIGSINIVKHPELMNTLSGLLIGNNIGSDIFQQNFVLPVVGLIGTIVVIKKNLMPEMGALILAALLVWLFALGGTIGRVEGLLLLIAYVGYLIYLKKNKISEKGIIPENNLSKKQVVLAMALILVAFGIMALAADKVLSASTVMLESLSISASFFGIILLGVASALPELTTSLIAIFKGKRDVSAGILIGSNITNPLFGIGIGALISKYVVPNVVIFYDLPVKIATAGLLYYFLTNKKGLQKWEAGVLIVLFIGYLVLRQIYFPVDF